MKVPHDFLKQLTGSFAEPAAENPTVEMIEAAYRHHNLPWRYINFEIPPAEPPLPHTYLVICPLVPRGTLGFTFAAPQCMVSIAVLALFPLVLNTPEQ